jgi:type I restriction enzyme S subunit
MIAGKSEQYDVYNDGGAEWLGQVPTTWRLQRHKDTFQLLAVRCDDKSLLKVALENIEGKTGRFIATESEFDGDGIQFKKNDILFGKLRPYLAKVYLAEFSGNAIGDIFVYRPRPNVHPRFGAYLMLSDRYIDIINSSTVGAKMPRVSSGFIADLPVAIPTISEQTAIANYLDTKTAQIDQQIDLLNQKATQYGKLKQSLINETVTRGLDKSVPMKNSGVEWIGEVPRHWEVQRIGTAFEERSEKVNDTDYPPLSVSMAGIVPQMESVAKTDNNENRKQVAIGDYVINSRSDRRGASGISTLDGSVSVINIVLKPRRQFFGKYLHHLFRSYRFIEEFYRVGRGIVDDLWTTRYSVMKGIEFSYPSYEEQKLIAYYLDEKTAQIDRIVTAINAQIENLKDLRKALINDVVTGKIKVVTEGADV